MAKERAKNIRLGLFVLISITLFIIAIYILGNQKNMFRPTFQIHAVFENTRGLKPGNNVRYSGIEAGTVEAVTILNDTAIQVTMVLEKNLQPYIKKNAVADIGTDGLVGNALVNIKPGKSKLPVEAVKEGDIIKTQENISTDEMLNTLGATNENIAAFSVHLLDISRKLNEGEGAMAVLLQDDQLANDLRQSIRNLRATSYALAQTGQQMESTLKELEQGDGLLNSLLYDTTVMADLQQFTGRLNGLLEDKIDPLLAELNKSGEDISQSSQSLQNILQELDEGKGAAGVLLNDTLMEDQMREMLMNLNQSSERLNENMLAIREHFLFKKYFRKMEKEEGKEKAGNN
jgi:phospholipid/cholesterol/gamma-HCH transport system substrate-binding protein